MTSCSSSGTKKRLNFHIIIIIIVVLFEVLLMLFCVKCFIIPNVPYFSQVTDYTCGAASTQMILTYWDRLYGRAMKRLVCYYLCVCCVCVNMISIVYPTKIYLHMHYLCCIYYITHMYKLIIENQKR